MNMNETFSQLPKSSAKIETTNRAT
jgi:hypothetical protein